VAAPYLPPNDWTPRLDAYFASPLALCARRVSSAASRLLGTASLRFALHSWQRRDFLNYTLNCTHIEKRTCAVEAAHQMTSNKRPIEQVQETKERISIRRIAKKLDITLEVERGVPGQQFENQSRCASIVTYQHGKVTPVVSIFDPLIRNLLHDTAPQLVMALPTQ
ncbi:hypothetical protein, partial [Thiolapillus sp.]